MPGKGYRKGVFVSYSHEDNAWLERLQVVLAPLARSEVISLWDDTRIPTGAGWAKEIEKAIASSRVAVLLVTPSFLASEFITRTELPRILYAHRERGLVVFWIAVSASAYKYTELVKFQAANDPSQPLDSLSGPEQNRALVRIAEKIARAVEINAIANTLSIVDDFAPQAEAFLENRDEPALGVPHRVIAHQRDDQISFGAVENPVETIKAEDLRELDPQSQQLIRSYEGTMKDLFDHWTELQPKRVARDPEVRKQAREESDAVRRDLCGQLNQILDFLTFMGKHLHDHYNHVRFICMP